MKHLLFFSTIISLQTLAQNGYWQQKVNYQMEIDMDVVKHQFAGKQKLTYYNNSPDTLTRVFYHLYFNAFQAKSMMDVRSRTIKDSDKRVGSRILNLSEEEIGYHEINSLTQDGDKLTYEVVETILEVTLANPILPNTSSVFEMEFNSQVPIQIRRSGRANKEGVDYSMTQWYPKLCEYDADGWHSNPYVGREFHGVWGDFDVKISIDSHYTIGGTGYLQNPKEIGKGYTSEFKRSNSTKLTWHFKAPNVHDFAWAADSHYIHKIVTTDEELNIHFFYLPDSTYEVYWDTLQTMMPKAFEIANKTFGQYPYKQYSIIQGGDGGMEYPMATLITGKRKIKSLLGVAVHEMYHSWYQGVIATNESKYGWMDEGFTSFAEDYTTDILWEKSSHNPQAGNYRGYFNMVNGNYQEPLTTHADHYHENRAYGRSVYSKGAVFLHQLSYVIGEEAFFKGMRRYFNEWKFKHPRPQDFKRIMEKTSGLELDWYLENWIQTTKTIDYGIKLVLGEKKQTQVTLLRKEQMPMPLDVVVTFKNGSQETYYIPLQIMRGKKRPENESAFIIKNDWPWTFPEYQFTIGHKLSDIEQIEIDPTNRMADIDKSDNQYPANSENIFVSD